MTSTRTCKDCAPGVKRPAPHPGPRCATHHREIRAQRRAAARARRVQAVYSISEQQYQRLYLAQGGVCAICRRAKGTGRRRLAVDHDHSCCSGPTSCGKCVRGLLCKSCNTILGRLRDDHEAFTRAADYLLNPPARKVLAA